MFGNEDLFPTGTKYTLEPLREFEFDALAPGDIEGVRNVRMVELWLGDPDSRYGVITIRKGDDLFDWAQAKKKDIHIERRLISASGFSLYLAKVSDPRRLDWCIDALLAETQRPFVLFLTSNRMLNSRNESALSARGCLIIPLEQAMLRSDDGEWNLSPWAREQLVTFRDRLMPRPQSTVGCFPTPAGSRWSDVEIEFKDGETVSVRISDQREVLSFTQLGLCDSRSGKPSKQWELLRTFAENHGVMTWQSPGACRQNRKRRELLNDSLRKFFDIEGDPIELTDDKKGWRCVIRLKSDRA